jgi:hypothetical protein
MSKIVAYNELILQELARAVNQEIVFPGVLIKFFQILNMKE